MSSVCRTEQGSVLVEFALILPLFMALLFGSIFFSVALYNKTVLTMATREGAREGVKFVAGRTSSTITSSASAAALDACGQNLISFGSTMAPEVVALIDGDLLRVTASGTYAGLFIFPALQLSSTTTMRIEE